MRDLRISWYQGKGVGEYLQFNNGEHLHHTPTGYFFESVGGIHLGMTLNEVREKYGLAQVIPPMQKFIDGNPNCTRWYYPKLGIVLWLDGECICHISLLKGSKLHFDRSGLSCQNTPEEFARAYSMDRIPELPPKGRDSLAYGIGHGENLYFGYDMNYVGLDIWSF